MQVERFGAVKQLELTMPHLRSAANAVDVESPTPPRAPLADMQLITAAASVAIQNDAERLVWPIQPGDDFRMIAHVTETILMVQQLVRFVHDRDLEIETPLLELTDRQLVEVGHQMDVPWEMSRSCLMQTAEPCFRCAGCRWRAKAFSQASILDPAVK